MRALTGKGPENDTCAIHMFDPLDRKMSGKEEQAAGDPDAKAILDMKKKDIAMYRRYSGK